MIQKAALRPAVPTVRRFTRAEYYEMERLGWFIGQRVELIAGEIIQMPAFNPPHPAATKLTEKALDLIQAHGEVRKLASSLRTKSYAKCSRHLHAGFE